MRKTIEPKNENSVSFKWTMTCFLAFCFLLYAGESKSTDSPQNNSEINTEQSIEQDMIRGRQ